MAPGAVLEVARGRRTRWWRDGCQLSPDVAREGQTFCRLVAGCCQARTTLKLVLSDVLNAING
ncbi:hypothetical protein A2U01_0107250 [Trifolium medium]|uniref:Uncharacterized protein n=1 Tax=Trifolium medium TaxID=97028 RepID=A0A392VG97_9FABA|nr:hypothetical protein [Trifolium medium]